MRDFTDVAPFHVTNAMAPVRSIFNFALFVIFLGLLVFPALAGLMHGAWMRVGSFYPARIPPLPGSRAKMRDVSEIAG